MIELDEVQFPVPCLVGKDFEVLETCVKRVFHRSRSMFADF